MAQKNKDGKKYKLSAAAQEIINESKKFKGKNGSFEHDRCPKLVDKMIKAGVVKNPSNYLKYLPKHYQPKGGFNGV